MNNLKIPYLFIGLLFVLMTTSHKNAADILSGRVYQGDKGTEPPASNAISGVTLKLFGSNNSDNLGVEIGVTITDNQGWYGLTATIGYEFYTIIETDPSGYFSVGATSVDGTVINDNQIRYSTVSAPLSDQTLTGNKFWDKPNAPENRPPVADANGPYTGKVGQPITLDGSGSYDPDPGDNIANYQWDTDQDGQYDDATGVNAQHTWNSVGNFTLGLRVSDSFGETDTDQTNVLITEDEPETGTIIIEKQTDPNGSSDIFNFIGDIAGSLTDGAQISVSNLQPGTYTSQELVPEGWNLSEIVLDDDNSSGDANAATATFHLEAGETVKAVFINVAIVEEDAFDFGDAPDPTYPTLLASNGARHRIDPDVYLGAQIDPDSDGQPDSGSVGDDDDGNDDEDGVVIKTSLIAGSSINVEVTASIEGFLNAWVDYNGNGNWGEAEDHVFINTPLSAGLNNLSINVPERAMPGATISRFRFSRAQGISFEGEAEDGEVEDYLVEIDPAEEKGSITIAKSATPPDSTVVFNFTGDLGSFTLSSGFNIVDFKNIPAKDYIIYETIPSGWALGTYQIAGDLDGGTTHDSLAARFTIDLDAGEDISIVIYNYQLGKIIVEKVTSPSGAPDIFTFTGDVSGSIKDGEQIILSNMVPSQYLVQEGVLAGWTLTEIIVNDLNSTINLGTRTATLNLEAGETIIVTYKNTKDEIPEVDFGDASDPSYPTLLANNGARHIIDPDVYLGAQIDGDPDGQPNSGATGDDNDGQDDEDGVVFKSSLIVGSSHQLEVTASTEGFLNAWVDYNRNGNWLETDEHVFINTPLSSGLNTLTLNIPSAAQAGTTSCRFRFSRSQGLDFEGEADDGEVEDYLIEIDQGGYRTALGDLVWNDLNQNGLQDQGEPGIGNVQVSLFDSSHILIAASSTLPNGFWGIWNITPGMYYLKFGLKPGYIFSPPDQSMDDTKDSDAQLTTGETALFILAPGDSILYMDAGMYLQELDFGDAPDPTYPTLLASNGARHVIVPNMHLGNSVDPDPNGQPDVNALGDDNDGNDDDDGVLWNWLLLGDENDLFISASSAGFLNAWLDLNLDGDWSDPGEQIFTDKNLTAGNNFLKVKIPASSIPGISTARFRFSTTSGLSYVGMAPDGEVEDRKMKISLADYGDAPQPYPTLLANNGARHITASNYHLGTGLDEESDGLPTSNALGDDNNGSDDEDGILFPPSLTQGKTVTITVSAQMTILNGDGYLNAWIDFNRDNDWSDPGEQIIKDTLLTHGTHTLNFNIPLNVSTGNTYARFRLSENIGTSFDGVAQYGEVEDYQITIDDTGSEGEIRGTKWHDLNGNRIQDLGEPGIPGWTIIVDYNQDGVLDPSPISQDLIDTTDAFGEYSFNNFFNGSYVVGELLINGWRQTYPDSSHASGIGNVGTYDHLVTLNPGQTITDIDFGNIYDGLEDEYDLGDAPDSSNHEDTVMVTYSIITAHFPTVFDPSTGLPSGPRHKSPKADCWLGPNVSLELDADRMPDQDGITNISPRANVADRDGDDDGLSLPIHLPHCRDTFLTYTVTIPAGSVGHDRYVNVWFDWNRDGDWEDVLFCLDSSDAPEWAVRNQLIPGSFPSGTYVFATPNFKSWHQDGNQQMPMWVRISIAEMTAPLAGDGRGPANGYKYGETEDYYIVSGQDDSKYDYGDAPDSNYHTLLANNGARHVIKQGFQLGSFNDADPDGFPSVLSDGDDVNPTAGPDDEDGITMSPIIAPGQAVPITIVASDTGVINAWIDYNINGSWADPGEQIIVAQPAYPGSNAFTINVPNSNVSSGLTYARFRFSSVRNVSYDGLAPDGEVEDYTVEIKKEGEDGSIKIIKEANPPDNTKFQFCTHHSSGFFNVICNDLQDPLNNQMTILNPGNLTKINEKVPNGWMLTNINITGDSDNGSTFDLSKAEVVPDFDPGENIVITFKNQREDVDDDQYDFGDAPDPQYPTLLASNGARHKIKPNLYLGSSIDPESDGQPGSMADGDNKNTFYPGTFYPPGDEDGVLLPSIITAGQSISMTVISSASGILNAWLDFNVDGDWADPGEHIIPALPVVAGVNAFVVNVPNQAQKGQSYARFRLSSIRNLSYNGPAPDGEVEDCAVAIQQGDGGNITIIKDATPKDNTSFWITTTYGTLGGAAPYRDPLNNTSTITNGPVGTYGFGESVPAGWSLTDIVVTGDSDNGSVINVGNATAQIDLDAGENITVVFKNVKSDDDAQYDFGDAPSPYPTKHADGGAYHLIDPNFRFGKFIDAESDGLPDPNAQGDDNDNLDDENEMSYIPGFLFFLNSSMEIPPQTLVKIFFAVDWERDSSWHNNDYDWLVFNAANFPVALDLSAIKLAISLTPGVYNARWRCYRDPSITSSPMGFGGVGEVEDCQFTVTGDEEVLYDYGDAPLPYPTKIIGPPVNSYGGRHPVVPGIHLGHSVDSEKDGQPDPHALGDDAGSDDEDGVVIKTPLIQGQKVSLEVSASVDGYLNAYIDLNQDNDWNDPNEQVFFEKSLVAGSNNLTFTLPISAKPGTTFARFRFSTDKLYLALPQQNVFLARDGEVEDYKIFVDEGEPGPPIKWMQSPLLNEDPEMPYTPYFMGWDEPSIFGDTIIADDWFCKSTHPITEIHWWGSYMDWDSTSVPPVAPYAFHIGVWRDVPSDEDWAWSHPGEMIWEWMVPRDSIHEHVVGDDFHPEYMTKPDTCFQYDYLIPESEWFYQETDSNIYWLSIAAIYDQKPDAFAWGWKTRGHYFHDDAVKIIRPKQPVIGDITLETKPVKHLWDMAFVLITDEYFLEYDFGDAPAERYQTLYGQNGALHIYDSTVFLGDLIDIEIDGQPDPNATGDDLDGTDDDDGVVIKSNLIPGKNVDVDVKASTSGFLNAWADFNNNGSWSDPDEQIFVDQALTQGVNALTFKMPSGALATSTFMRFRFSHEAGISFFGLALDGEVEDYYVDENLVGINETDNGMYKLIQNYPNPFSAYTDIQFEIPDPVFVRLTVYNLYGQEISRLINERRSPGNYTTRWNGKDKYGKALPAGVYIYRMEAGDFNATRKLLHMK